MHFTIGENAGILLMQIAQEHLLERYDPEKALNTITGSLVGIPITMARDVLIGDKVLEVDVESQEFIVATYDESKHEDFPRVDIKEWYIRTHKRIGDDGRKLHSGLGKAIKYNSSSYGSFKKEFDFASIIQFIHGNSKPVLQELDYDHRVDDIKSVITTVKRFVEKSNRAYYLMDWLEATYPKKYEPTDNPLESISRGRHNVVDMLDIRLRQLLGNGIQAILEEMTAEC